MSLVPSASSHRPLGHGDASLGARGSPGHIHPSMSMLQVRLAARACFVFAFWLCQVQPHITPTVCLRGWIVSPEDSAAWRSLWGGFVSHGPGLEGSGGEVSKQQAELGEKCCSACG